MTDLETKLHVVECDLRTLWMEAAEPKALDIRCGTGPHLLAPTV